ncbi:aquaporin family protein [Winogradskyella litoriviva]|uniref:Aquaporin family protein n=1 Tax=Winogradskyella litoriviva TaxID=1220182 RepID=A0ABX2E291_9FLAO|nr:MIP/aquaporin family protein [Winogradskyella litoriviva]NRD22352.1 aquaporin family protein [Winogradskyella litoriviva]
MSILVAEILGTMILIICGNGVVANVVLNGTKGNGAGWIEITTSWALGVFLGVIIAGPYSGAHLNPAVTIALATAGKLSWAVVPEYFAGEFIGAMLGALIVWIFYKDHFKITDDEAGKLACFCTGPAIRKTSSNLISEIIGTFVLIFVIFYLSGPTINLGIEGTTEAVIGLGSIGAIPVAFLVWVIGLALGGTTGYAINPARDLGPRIMHAILPVKGSSDWSYAWIPVVGPIIGSLIATGLYLYLM